MLRRAKLADLYAIVVQNLAGFRYKGLREIWPVHASETSVQMHVPAFRTHQVRVSMKCLRPAA